MAAWMARAAAKELHLAWGDKIRDYADELSKLRKTRMAANEIVRQRRHLNPPELARSYSSIQPHEDCALVKGLGWARSCLDSSAAWQPASMSMTEWMEIDAGEEMEILGIVTQGQAATGCSGTRGVCKGLCAPPHSPTRCNGAGGECNWVTRVCIKHRRADKHHKWIRLDHDLDIGVGGEARHEAVFAAPVRARYVRISPIDFRGSRVGLRAGLLVRGLAGSCSASPLALPSTLLSQMQSAEEEGMDARVPVEMHKQQHKQQQKQPSTKEAEALKLIAAGGAKGCSGGKASRWLSRSSAAAAATAAAAGVLPAACPHPPPLPLAQCQLARRTCNSQRARCVCVCV